MTRPLFKSWTWSVFILLVIVCFLSSSSQSLVQMQPPDFGKRRTNEIFSSDADTAKLPMVAVAESLSAFFQDLMDSELGLNETKTFYQSNSFETRNGQSLEDQAKSLGNNFSLQVDTYIEAVERLADSVKLLSLINDTRILHKCCELKSGSLSYDDEYKTKVRKDMACWSAVSRSKTNLFVPSHFSQAMIKNSMKFPYLRWQYFVSPEGIYVEYPANRENCQVPTSGTVDGPRPIFIPKTHPERKMWLIQKSKDDSRIHRVVFLIQLKQNPSMDVINAVKSIVTMLLRFMDEGNEVGIVNIDPEDLSTDFLCDQLVAVTSWTRYQILSYLNYIEQRYKVQASDGGDMEKLKTTDTSWALDKSFQMACANFSALPRFPPTVATVIHLTTDLHLANFTSALPLNSPCPIFIESYYLGKMGNEEDLKYKMQIQGSSSNKNIWNVRVHSMAQMEPESFAIKVALKLNSKKELWSLSDILSQFFPEEPKNSTTGIELTPPHWNPVSRESVIVAKKYVFHNGHALGLVAVEIPVVHFTQLISYYINENQCDAKNYAFLIDSNGRVIAHPSVGKPSSSEEALTQIQIGQVEVREGFASLKKRLLSPAEPSGCQSLHEPRRNGWVTYAWSGVQNYIVVIVAFGDSGGCFPYREEVILKKSWLSPKADVQHHLLLETEQCCDNQAFSINKASLYLAPSAFSNPATHLSHNQPIKQSMAVMAFISDNSGLLRNQNKGLKSSVKDHVGVLSNVLPTWKVQSQNSIWRKYIQRRFGAAAGGTFLLVHPGISMTPGYLPYSSAWFRKSVTGNGKIIFSPPKANSLGSPINTISTVVKAMGMGSPGPAIAILGATVSVGFFEKLLSDLVPECGFARRRGMKNEKLAVRCVLFDERGYVVYHQGLAKFIQTTSPFVHLTQIEPLSAIDILQSATVGVLPLRKETCHKFSETSATQESLQRFYTFNVPATGMRKTKHAEVCNNYEIVPIPNTNLFLAKIRDNCTSAAFCPCSTVDNICLNCLRIELSDCECPCECPREPTSCSTQGFMELLPEIEPCEFPEELMSLDGSPCAKPSLTCEYRIPCDKVLEAENCFGLHDCTWCESGNSAECKTFEQCYGSNGVFPEVLGNRFSVSGGSVGGKRSPDENQITIVPILAVLAVFLIFLGLVFYCYRHRLLRSALSQPDVSLLPLQESPMGSVIPQAGSSRSNSDAEMEQDPVLYVRRHPRRPQNHSVQPPCSPLGSVFTESDNGYSTMTQNEDCSEGGGAGVPAQIYSPEPMKYNKNQVGSSCGVSKSQGLVN